VLTVYGLPMLRWLEVTVGDFHAYLCRWVDLWEDPAIGHWQSGTDAPDEAEASAR
jgi:hypothetical protein